MDGTAGDISMKKKYTYKEIYTLLSKYYDKVYDIYEYKGKRYSFLGATMLAGNNGEPKLMAKYCAVDWVSDAIEFVRDLDDFFEKFKLVERLPED